MGVALEEWEKDAMLKLRSEGASQEDIFGALESFKVKDLDYRGGHNFAYVYDAGREAEAVGKKAFAMYLTENGLDPTVFPSLLKLENDLIAIALSHLSGDENSVGTFTSGGTESIILAVKSARDHARATRPEITEPEMILPETAHAAFHKASHYLGVKVVLSPVDPVTFKAIPEAIEERITDNTILLVGSTPSYAHGVVDPIPAMGRIAEKHNLLLHVDACVGGWLLPYWRRLGADIPDFDFQVPGVTSISMDFHKYAFTPKGASVVLYRDRAVRRRQIYACANWTGYSVVNAAVQSSKSGGPLAGAWAVLNHFGDAGYLKIAQDVKDATERLVEGVAAIEGLRIMGTPDMCMFAFTSDDINVFHIIDECNSRGWYIQPQLAFGDHKEGIHLSVQPGNVNWVEPFLKDLAASVESARALPSGQLAAALGDQLGSIDADELTDEQIMGFMAMAGVDGTTLPDRRASINELLNILPRKLNEALLVTFINTTFHPSDD